MRQRCVLYDLFESGVGRADPIAEVLLAQDADLIALFDVGDDVVLQRLASRLSLTLVASPSARVALLTKLEVARVINHAPSGRAPLLEVELLAQPGTLDIALAPDRAALASLSSHTDLVALGAECSQSSGALVPLIRDTPDHHNKPTTGPDRLACQLLGSKQIAVQSVRIERDRLARYASESFPVVIDVDVAPHKPSPH